MNDSTKIDMARAISAGTHYDDAEKSLWRHKELIAPVLKFVIKELNEYSVEEIIGFIDGTTISREEYVSPMPDHIDMVNTELSSTVEKLLRFDVKFCMVNPALKESEDDKPHRLHVDYEPQHDYYPSNPSYPIVKRGLYYAARELSSQLSETTQQTNYAQLEKVVSIWVCNFGVPRSKVNTVSRYFIQKEDVIGKTEEKHEFYDLMECIIIRRDDTIPAENSDNVFDFLQAVYSGNVERVDHYVNLSNKPDIKEEVSSMTYSQTLYMQGVTKGKGEERENMIVRAAKAVLDNKIDIESGALVLGMSAEEFAEKAYLLGFDLRKVK